MNTAEEVAQLEARIAVLNGTATEAQKAMAGLGDAAKGAGRDAIQAMSDFEKLKQQLEIQRDTIGLSGVDALRARLVQEQDEKTGKAKYTPSEVEQLVAIQRGIDAKQVVKWREEIDLSVASMNDLAAAAGKGGDAVAALELQLRVEQEVLRRGEDARQAVTEALTREDAARRRLDLATFVAGLERETAALDRLAEAHGRGAAAVKQAELQNRIEAEVLKQGESARRALTDAILAEDAARRRLDVASSIASLREEVDLLERRARVAGLGPEAQRAFDRSEFELQTRGQLGEDLGPLSPDAMARLEEAMRLYDRRAGLDSDIGRKNISRELEDEIVNNDRLVAALRQGTKAYEEQAAVIEIINRYRQAGVAITPEIEADAARQAKAIGQQRDEINRLRTHWEEVERAGADATRVIANGFEEAILEGKDLGDVLRSLVKDLSQIGMRTFFTKPLENMMTGGSGGGSFWDMILNRGGIAGQGGGSGGGFLGSLIGGIGSLFGFGGASVGGSATSLGSGQVYGAAPGITASMLGGLHTGGVVGHHETFRRFVTTPRDVARRYHSGGVVGLAANEMPIIAERGEEVLTRDDPRHRWNGGGDGGGSPVIVQPQIHFHGDAYARNPQRVVEPVKRALKDAYSEGMRQRARNE